MCLPLTDAFDPLKLGTGDPGEEAGQRRFRHEDVNPLRTLLGVYWWGESTHNFGLESKKHT